MRSNTNSQSETVASAERRPHPALLCRRPGSWAGWPQAGCGGARSSHPLSLAIGVIRAAALRVFPTPKSAVPPALAAARKLSASVFIGWFYGPTTAFRRAHSGASGGKIKTQSADFIRFGGGLGIYKSVEAALKEKVACDLESHDPLLSILRSSGILRNDAVEFLGSTAAPAVLRRARAPNPGAPGRPKRWLCFTRPVWAARARPTAPGAGALPLPNGIVPAAAGVRRP